MCVCVYAFQTAVIAVFIVTLVQILDNTTAAHPRILVHVHVYIIMCMQVHVPYFSSHGYY